jgi:hypothetical protein
MAQAEGWFRFFVERHIHLEVARRAEADLEAEAVKRLAGDLQIAPSTLNKYLHAAGRDDLVGKDYKRAPVHANRGCGPAQNPPPENEGEYLNNGENGGAA